MVRSICRNGRKHCGTNSSQLRHGHVRHPSCNSEIARFDRGAEPVTPDQSEGRREVAQARDGRGSQAGPKEPRSSVLSEADEAIVVVFRRYTLGDCL